MALSKKQREARNEIDKSKLDFSVPIDITQLGSENDICFGKHFWKDAPECNRCGDSELCILMMGQNNHRLRGKIEAKEKFKDLQDLEAPEHTEKDVLAYLRRKLKKYPKDKEKVVRLTVKKFKPLVSKFEIEGLLNKITKKNNGR